MGCSVNFEFVTVTICNKKWLWRWGKVYMRKHNTGRFSYKILLVSIVLCVLFILCLGCGDHQKETPTFCVDKMIALSHEDYNSEACLVDEFGNAYSCKNYEYSEVEDYCSVHGIEFSEPYAYHIVEGWHYFYVIRPIKNEVALPFLIQFSENGESGISKNNYSCIWTLKVMKEPPALMVVCGDKNVEALRGTTSWMYQNEDNINTGINSDNIHPLQAKEYMSPLEITYTPISSIDPLKAYLQWGVVPDSISVRCWDEMCWGQFDADGLAVPIEVFETDTTDEIYSTNYTIKLKDGNYIYEVKAEWNGDDNYGGTVYYSFYTITPSTELHPVS